MILASQSPRRKELLSLIHDKFVVMPADIDESVLSGERPDAFVERLAKTKAETVAKQVDFGEIVIAADTAVAVDGLILNKPIDWSDFQFMMSRLSGRTHQVYTGVCVLSAGVIKQAVVCTDVTLRAITAEEQADYWASGEPSDKAGGYGIQGRAARFVARIEGSYTNVVGLPLVELEALLTDAT